MTVPSNKILSMILSEVRGKKPKELDSEDVLAILSCGTNFMTVYCMLQTYGRDMKNIDKHNQGIELITPIMDALYNRYIELWGDKEEILDALEGRVELRIVDGFLECHFYEAA